MRRGLAVAPVQNGTCQGCNMNIPPQLFNQLQRGDSIELCATCNRIIYWDKLLENPDGAAGRVRRISRSRSSIRLGTFVGEGEVVAGGASRERKVRAPQGRVLANGRSGRPEGKCHRKQTAVAKDGKGETVR